MYTRFVKTIAYFKSCNWAEIVHDPNYNGCTHFRTKVDTFKSKG